MNSLGLEILLLVVQTFGWLVIVLPLFETLHLRLFRSTHRRTRVPFQFSNWFLTFFKAITQRAANDQTRFISYSRKTLLFVLLIFGVMGISLLPLSSAMIFDGRNYFADNGSEVFSTYLLLGLLLALGVIYLLIGFSLDKPFISLTSIEKSVARQSALLAVAFACATTPFVRFDISLRAIVELQMTPMIGALPAWGALVNPVAFICASVAVAIYVRQWQEEEFPPSSVLKKSIQGELLSIELVTYRVARSVDYLLLYSLIVIAFLGGPFLGETSLHPIFAIGIFTLKVFGFATVVLAINFFLPQVHRSQFLRVVFLVLLPMELVGYPLSLALCELLNLH